ncbi:MAG: hypothetical protein M1324_00800 [Patescibacteria group bacterium]|nr:hypothetical protein [Patescibacteria group bacterium]
MNKERGKIVFWVTIAVVLLVAILIFGFYFPYKNKTKAPTKTPEKTTEESNQNNQSLTSSSNFDNKTTTNSSTTTATPDTSQSAESTDPNYYYTLGLKSTSEKNYSDAISNFSKAIELNPKAPDYYSKKAEAEVLSGKDTHKKTLQY